MNISENIQRLRVQMGEASVKSGRSPADILLVAATKTQPKEPIVKAIESGVDACGENRVQELTEKNAQNTYAGAPLHFIGHLQKNKVNKVVGICDLIQSVDSEELLTLISKQAKALNIIQDVLIQVNIGNDPAKFGVPAEGAIKMLEHARGLDSIKVRGLMTIPQISETSGENRRFFAAMYNLFVDIRGKTYDNVSMDFLSMGMSEDFYDAILEGANMVRVGSSIFGVRNYI